MTDALLWPAALATVAIILAYEIVLAVLERRGPGSLARSAHARLREDWFDAVSAQKGSEVLAVQTLRNSLMSATMTASTAALALMGTLTLSAPSLQASLARGWPQPTPRLLMELALIALLFASLVCSALAVRYYNHAGFICGMPVESAARKNWAPTGRAHLRRAGVLYSWALRQLVLVMPAVAFMLHPLAGPAGALLLVAVLLPFDRFRP